MKNATPSNIDPSRLYKLLLFENKIINQTDFGEQLGYKKSFTSRMLNGNAKLPDDIVNKVYETYNLSASEWVGLYPNDSRKIGDPNHDVLYTNKSGNIFVEQPESGEYEFITKLVTVKAQAGFIKSAVKPIHRFSVDGM